MVNMGVVFLLKEYFPGSKFSKSLLEMYANQLFNQGSRIAAPFERIEIELIAPTPNDAFSLDIR